MTATEQDVNIKERESKTIDPSPLEDKNGDIVDLTNAELSWIVYDRDNTLIEKDTESAGGITITEAVNGKWEIDLEPSDTDGLGGGYYKHEARLIDVNDNESVVMEGDFDVSESYT